MKYSEIHIGQNAEIVHKITADDIQKFVELTGDDNKLHLDEEYASQTSFKKPVAHGMLGASFISTIIGTKIPGDGALWFSQSIEFLLPVRIGDTLKINAEVIDKQDREQIVVLKTEIFNQHKQKVLTGTSKVKVVEQEKLDVAGPEEEMKERYALILGASGGIGSVVADELESKGYKIFTHGFSNLRILQEKANKNRRVLKGDLTDENHVLSLFQEIKRHTDKLAVLVNATTIPVPNIEFANLEWSDLQKQLDSQLKSSYLLLKHALPYLENAHGSSVIFITSQTVDYPFGKLSHYTAAKSALQGFGRSMALDLSAKNIRINMVSPGITETELNADLPQKVRLITAAKTPIKRLAHARDVAHAIVFLAEDTSRFITGETIRVNGGQIML